MGRIATSSLIICFVISCILIHHASSEKIMKEQAGTCCKTCSVCTRSFPPSCRCDDLFTKCPPKCTECEKVKPKSGSTSATTPLFRCQSFLKDPCNSPCEKASTLNQ